MSRRVDYPQWAFHRRWASQWTPKKSTHSVGVLKEITHTGMKVAPHAKLQFRQFPM